jgi:3-hydroxybutyryl-CoA dehydrogenase
MAVERVGVVGAGVMGIGLAHALARTGHRVLLIDITVEKLDHARREIRQNLRTEKLLNPSARQHSPAEVLDRIAASTDYALLRDADFVIENVPEKPALKEEVWRRIDAEAPERAVLAANTSAISITRIAAFTRRPDKVVGIHFMNPVPLKDTVEVIRGFHTSGETLATVRALLAAMEKAGIVVRDMPGFVSNRVLMLMINEAIWLVQDGVASAQDVDRLFQSCFGHKMGPLATADLIGLDTILYSIDVLYESYADPKFRACPLLKQLVDAGLHGRKTGRGFFSYDSIFAGRTQA